jgi:tetratricopeptide (TPR) repeat protein
MKTTIKNATSVFQEAINIANDLMEEHEKTGDQFPLAVSAYLVREYDTAIEVLKSDIDHSLNGQYEAQLALCYFRIEEHDDAELWIRKAISISEKGTIRAHILKQDLSYISLLAKILLVQGKAAEAISACQVAVSAASNDELALSTMGLAKMAMGELKQAKKLLEKARSFSGKKGKNSNRVYPLDTYIATVQVLLDKELEGIPATAPIATMREGGEV